jgi:CHAD domain-containing protein
MATVVPAQPVDEHSDDLELLTVQTFAWQAVQKHFHKATRYEAEVLGDQDPEPLHQMRVGLRRLRTALTVFAPFLSLPLTLDRNIAKISKRLGAVRDLDVLRLWFYHYQADTGLSAAESIQFEVVLQRLSQQRQKQCKRMAKLLKGKRYRQFGSELQQWLHQPTFRAGAEWPMRLVLPDLLLPLIHQLLLHPGWLSGTVGAPECRIPHADIIAPLETVYFAEYGAVLHNLRKQIKRVRYQTEFFTDFYGSDYAAQVLEFKALQDLLGEWQDSQVLSNFLAQTLGQQWPQHLPALSQYFQQQQADLWQQWRPFQQQYLSAPFRSQLRLLIAQP